jgi:LysM repeat protein
MTHIGRRAEIARYGAAAAFLAAVTIAALLVRSGISSSDQPSSTSTPAQHTVTKQKYVPPSKRRYYRVRNGDTLAGIAFRFKTTVGQIKRFNPGIRAISLQLGQRIRVK